MKTKKLLVTLFLTFLVLFHVNYVFSAETVLEEPTLTAGAAILLDTKTNQILYHKNENKKMYPASTTKILTAILVLEHCNLSDVVTASYDTVMSIPEGYTSANIQIGEKLTVEQLLQVLLVHSANDAANMLAEYVGGSVDSFVSMMNTKANELGLTNSHFTNAYGKHDENHYTTAHDLAFLMKYCLKNDTFRKMAGQASCAIPATNQYQTRSYQSTNELIIPTSKNYYRYLTAGKTGTTTQAKQCLVSAAYRDNLELIGVVLGSDNRLSDTRNLYEYAYSNYSIKTIATQKDVVTNIQVSNATKDTKNLDLLICENISALVNHSDSLSEIVPKITLNENISAPIDEGSILGKITYSIHGVEYTTDLVAAHSVEKSKLFIYLIYVGIILILLFFLNRIFFHKKKTKRKVKSV